MPVHQHHPTTGKAAADIFSGALATAQPHQPDMTLRDHLPWIELGSRVLTDQVFENLGPLADRAYEVAGRVVEAWARAQHKAEQAANGAAA